MTSPANPLSPFFVGQGFQVADLFAATGGRLGYRLEYEVGETAPPGGAQDVLGVRYGVDLAFDGDLKRTGAADLALTSGSDGIRGALMRALITEPGEIFWRPRYGVGLTSLINQSITAELLAEIEVRVRNSFEEEPDVDELENLDVSSNMSNLIDIQVAVRLRGAPVAPVGVRIQREP